MVEYPILPAAIDLSLLPVTYSMLFSIALAASFSPRKSSIIAAAPIAASGEDGNGQVQGQANIPDGEPVDEDGGKARPAPSEKGKKPGLKQRLPDNAHVQPCIGGSKSRPDVQVFGVERAVQKDGGKGEESEQGPEAAPKAEQQDEEQGEALKGLIVRRVDLNEDVRERGGARGQDERSVQKQAHGKEHDAFAPKAEEEKGERAEQVGPDVEEQGGADGRAEKGNAEEAPDKGAGGDGLKTAVPQWGVCLAGCLGHCRSLRLRCRMARVRPASAPPIMPTPKALGRLSEKPASAYRTPIEPPMRMPRSRKCRMISLSLTIYEYRTLFSMYGTCYRQAQTRSFE